MQFTHFTDYSLRTLIYLGALQSRLVTISEVAENYGISQSHLTKVVHQLANRGYIQTTRGKGGGMRLARLPQLINIGDVVRDMEENIDLVECFNTKNQSCPLLPACTLKSVLAEARKNFFDTLDRYTLADLLTNQSSLRRMLELQKSAH
ncbi:Rrf2 family transcriptional regulator [Candidatus Nitrotoga sp. 1052]|uniref:Rrf2 family transcriptional regulator n=1 Tax=Candidatus Nitrotoga sp. 1052 TaxID=2886964 RepID=UPI001EF52656|nr:Rrf2 family transcriptional regulator [Candidatus Nitrotoga sp. 1052]CAH1079960.1 HTH-type transcriptional regulator NsrR [Candidatus Nitrotoga sp. 1052]